MMALPRVEKDVDILHQHLVQSLLKFINQKGKKKKEKVP